MPDPETEYKEALSYLQHMFDTRHRIFNFTIALNAGFLAIVFRLAQTTGARLLLCGVGLIITTCMMLMARRSAEYLNQMEIYTEEIEGPLGFGLVAKTNQRMPKAVTSTQYLFFAYWVLVIVWILLTVYQLLISLGFPLPPI